MPTIPCQVRKQFGDAKMPFVAMSVDAKNPRIRCRTLALVDTGSPYTGISPRDVLRSRIGTKPPKQAETIGLAGFKLFKRDLRNTTITLPIEGRKTMSFQFDDMCAFYPTKTDSKIMGKIQAIPSLMGADFLETHGIALYFNPKAERAYLEAPEE